MGRRLAGEVVDRVHIVLVRARWTRGAMTGGAHPFVPILTLANVPPFINEKILTDSLYVTGILVLSAWQTLVIICALVFTQSRR
jgi:hypothetical protein